MGKDLTGKELGKGFTQRKDGRYQTRISLGGGKKPICLYGHTLKEVKKKGKIIRKNKIRIRYRHTQNNSKSVV